MGFFSDNDKVLRDARHELNDQCDNERKAMRRGDEDATRRNLDLQAKVRDAEQGASKVARWIW